MWCSKPYNTCGIPGQKWPIKKTTTYKSLIIPYFHPILASIFLSTGSLSMGSMHGGISGEGVRMLDNFRRS